MLATRPRFTRAEYYRMVEVGILGKRDQVELIKGEIVEKFPTHVPGLFCYRCPRPHIRYAAPGAATPAHPK